VPSAIVAVGPPLSANGCSFGSVLLWLEASLNPQLPSELMLPPPSWKLPPQLLPPEPGFGLPKMVLRTLRAEKMARPWAPVVPAEAWLPPAAPPWQELLAIVLLSSEPPA
jgi:hypothetical protein